MVPGLARTIRLVTLEEMLPIPVVAAFVSDLSPAARRGIHQGIALAGSLGAALGPPLASVVLDVAPGPALWAGSAVLLLVLSGVYVALGRMADGLPPAAET